MAIRSSPFARILRSGNFQPLSRHDRIYSFTYMLAGALLISLIAFHNRRSDTLTTRKDTVVVGIGAASFVAGLLLLLSYYSVLGLRVWRPLLAGVSASGGGVGIAAVFWKGSLWVGIAFALWDWCLATYIVAKIDRFWALELPTSEVSAGVFELAGEDEDEELM